MKNYIKITIVAVLCLFIQACQEEDQEFGPVVAPTNIDLQLTYLDDIDGDGVLDEVDAPGLGSGFVKFTATADNALSFVYEVNNIRTTAVNGKATLVFSTLGLNTYNATVIAYGTGGASSSQTIQLDVLSTFEVPAELITMLTNDSQRTWRIKAEVNNHFGLGPVGGGFNEFFQAPAFDKEGVGMYDDRYIFNVDGTFTHITDNTNDDPDVNPEGTVFGREVLIDELNGPGSGTSNGADIENYPYSDYSESWFITGPGGVETLNLTGIGFLGYYTGGDHTYIIESRSINEMVVRTTDGNGEFDWGFILIADE
ncbi:glucan endo-1,3-beta-D-glucosidase [Winogradskyella aurantia]|uniref:Glucan endo-1,3-beta-D-glucosidase n=1 Tax=Winogradskyella aurantia TaxID=1915063 RepID=A0A265UPM0_9FLAO|nr:glucan endo-1,3-beta-D-glucosidase [Winogradskyella aurantia]OZV67218.1 hypothetical protein CA834_12945 [Winogradskyella aurantia]